MDFEVEQFLGKKSPIQKFEEWFDEAKKTSLKNPEAFMLTTVGKDLVPHARVVLMKDLSERGLTFYTNYESQKSQDLNYHPVTTALFFWDPLFRQVRWTGKIEKVPRAVSEAYWRTRPRISQISGWASRQSKGVANRAQMDSEYQDLEKKFANQEVPCPPHWGGFLIVPTYVEFWLGRDGRFHDRWTYQKVQDRWVGQRLYP